MTDGGPDKAPELDDLAAELAELEQALEDAESAIAAAESDPPPAPPAETAEGGSPPPPHLPFPTHSPPPTIDAPEPQSEPPLPDPALGAPPTIDAPEPQSEPPLPDPALGAPPTIDASDSIETYGNVDLEGSSEPSPAPPAEPQTIAAGPILAVYGSFVAALEDVIGGMRRGAPPPLVGLHRAAQALVAVPERASPLLQLVAVTGPYRSSEEGRLAQVATLVALMAARVGHDESDRRDMAVATALALSGRALREDLADADTPACGAAGVFLDGVRRLLPVSGKGRAAALRMIVAADISEAKTRRSGHPLSLLVVAADAFERLTRSSEMGGAGLRADEALERLRSDDTIDRSSRVGLLAALGPFPVGTRVRLSSEETAVVVSPPRSAERLSDPTVMVVADALGNPAGGRCIDLSTSDVTIARAVSQTEADLGVGHFMFA